MTTLPDDFVCGLYSKDKGAMPLRGLAIKAHVVDMVSEVEVSQRYFNSAAVPIEAVFKFNQEECSIFGFEAVIDGHKVVGEVKEKEEARNIYEDAMSSGGHGFMLSRDEKNKKAFNMSVGNLPPGKECTITFRYVSELVNEGHNVRLNFPITSLQITSTKDINDLWVEQSVKDGLHVDIDVEMPLNIHTVESPSGHTIKTNVTKNTAHIEFHSTGSQVSYGLVVLIGQQSAGEPQALVEIDREAGTAAAMVSFIAELEQLRDSDIIAEVIFIIDRSGSMSGSRINQAKSALGLFLHSLPVGTRFNVVGFGSSYRTMFTSSRVYDDATLELANDYVQKIEADMGGTEILSPLRAVLSSPVDPLYPRQVFVLTDGEVSNTEAVIDYVRKHAKDTRVFTLGIGSDVSSALVNGIAKAGRGEAEFVISGERMEAKVLRQLKRALQPVLKQSQLDFGGSEAVKAQAPKALPPVFDGDRIISYAFFNTTDVAQIEEALSRAEFKARTDAEGKEDLRLKILGEDKARVKEGKLIHRLAARSLIKELEESEQGADAHKAEITELALRYGLVSAFTSFVATAEGDQAVEGTMHQVEISAGVSLQQQCQPQAHIAQSSYIASPAVRRPTSDRIHEINAQIDDVRAVMVTNIDKLLERGERLDSLVDRTESLEESAVMFRKSSRSLSGGGMLSNLMDSVTSFFSPSNWSSSSSSSSSLPRNSAPSVALACNEVEIQPAAAPAPKKAFDCDQFDSFAASPAQPSSQSAIASPPPSTSTSTTTASVIPTSNASLSKKKNAGGAHMRPLDRFVHHQRANGSWQLDENLAQALGCSLAELTTSLPTGVPADLWATALALAALEANYADQQEEWELLAGKAKRWLAREWTKLGDRSDTLASLQAEAAKFVQAK